MTCDAYVSDSLCGDTPSTMPQSPSPCALLTQFEEDSDTQQFQDDMPLPKPLSPCSLQSPLPPEDPLHVQEFAAQTQVDEEEEEEKGREKIGTDAPAEACAPQGEDETMGTSNAFDKQ